MKKLNFVFIALLTCMFISCKPTVDSYPCEHCGILYFTPEAAEACPCERTCSRCGFVYDTPEGVKECSRYIGCPHGYLSAEAEKKYTFGGYGTLSSEELENAQNLYKDICDYVKTSEFDDSYKNLCTLDFSGVKTVCYFSVSKEFMSLTITLSNDSKINCGKHGEDEEFKLEK